MNSLNDIRRNRISRRTFCGAMFGGVVLAMLGGVAHFRPPWTSPPINPSDTDGDYVIIGGWVLTTHELTSDDTSV